MTDYADGNVDIAARLLCAETLFLFPVFPTPLFGFFCDSNTIQATNDISISSNGQVTKQYLPCVSTYAFINSSLQYNHVGLRQLASSSVDVVTMINDSIKYLPIMCITQDSLCLRKSRPPLGSAPRSIGADTRCTLVAATSSKMRRAFTASASKITRRTGHSWSSPLLHTVETLYQDQLVP